MESSRGRLAELAALFLRLGLTAFGGPAAHVAMMQQEVVERRKWLTPQAFLDMHGATNFIPGPNSTELAIHIGHHRAGWKGLIVAGTCFIVPAVALTTGLAWAYVRFGQLPAATAVLYGVKPVIVAVVAQALWALGRSAVKNKFLGLLGGLAAAASMVGANELLVLFAAGLLATLRAPPPPPAKATEPAPAKPNVLLLGLPGVAAGATAASVSSSSIFLVFLKIGSVLFGSGYVLLAFLRADLVQERHWLTEGQLLDAVAAGQMTPGPVFSTATFVGYLMLGWRGALAATLGIFLPAFAFVAMSSPLLPRLRASPRAALFLDGLNVASLALMALVSFNLARAAIVDPWTLAILGVSAVLLLRFKVNSAWLVLGGAVAGGVIRRLL